MHPKCDGLGDAHGEIGPLQLPANSARWLPKAKDPRLVFKQPADFRLAESPMGKLFGTVMPFASQTNEAGCIESGLLPRPPDGGVCVREQRWICETHER